MVSRIFQGFYHQWHHLGFASGAAKTGAALIGGAVFVYATASEERNKKWSDMGVSVVRSLGVSDRISNKEIKTNFYRCIENICCIVAASPSFYFAYYAIHRNQRVPLAKHLFESILKGYSGTLASTPALAGMYTLATGILPIAEDLLLRRGVDKETAHEAAKGIAFLGLGAPVELYVEAKGCSVQKIPFRLGLLGTACISMRSLAGILNMWNATEQKILTPEEAIAKKIKDWAVAIMGTTAAQHLLNGTMQSMTHRQGFAGVGRYLKFGNVTGAKFPLESPKRFLGTLGQRILFMTIWNELTHHPRKTPKWVDG